MKKEAKKKTPRNLITLSLLIAGLLAFAALSFGPCVDTTKAASFSPSYISDDLPVVTSTTGYLPKFCCLVTVLELLLLIPRPRIWLRIVGMLLCGAKMFFPLRLLRFFELIFTDIGGSSRHFSLNTLGYGLIALGGLVLLAYLADLLAVHSAKKALSAAQPCGGAFPARQPSPGGVDFAVPSGPEQEK